MLPAVSCGVPRMTGSWAGPQSERATTVRNFAPAAQLRNLRPFRLGCACERPVQPALCCQLNQRQTLDFPPRRNLFEDILISCGGPPMNLDALPRNPKVPRPFDPAVGREFRPSRLVIRPQCLVHDLEAEWKRRTRGANRWQARGAGARRPMFCVRKERSKGELWH